MDQTRPWYKKKRFLVPIGLVGVLTALGLTSSGPAPTAVQSTQPVTTQQVNTLSTEKAATTEPAPPAQTNIAPTPAAPEAPPKSTNTQLSNNDYYNNVDGNTVHSPAYTEDSSVPASASAKCGDGTYSFSQHRQGTCSHHGGVATWY